MIILLTLFLLLLTSEYLAYILRLSLLNSFAFLYLPCLIVVGSLFLHVVSLAFLGLAFQPVAQLVFLLLLVVLFA